MPRRPRSGTIKPMRNADGSLDRDAEGLIRFDIFYYDALAKQRHTRRRFRTQAEAEKWIHAQREGPALPVVNRNRPAPQPKPEDPGPTWREIHQAWENAHRALSSSQIKKVSRTVERLEERLGAGCRFKEATGERVREMILNIGTKSGPVAARHALAHLKSVARWARGELLIPENIPYEHLKAPAHKAKPTGPVPLEQIPALLAALGPWTLPIVRWIALTGCRQQDAAGILLADVTDQEATLRVKGGRKIVYRLDAPLLDCLAAARLQCEAAGVQTAYAFPNSAGNRWTDTHLAHTIKIAWSQLGPWRLHALRHTFATMAGRLGYGADMIKAALGHLARATSERYTHTAADDSARAEVGAAVRAEILRHTEQHTAQESPTHNNTPTTHKEHGSREGQGMAGNDKEAVTVTIGERKILVNKELAAKALAVLGVT